MDIFDCVLMFLKLIIDWFSILQSFKRKITKKHFVTLHSNEAGIDNKYYYYTIVNLYEMIIIKDELQSFIVSNDN